MKKIIGKIILFLFAICSLQIAESQPMLEWAARYERPSGSNGLPNYLALDKVGNSYVLGSIPVTGNYGGMVLIKYNSSGDTVFTRSYNLGENNACIVAAVAADSIGNVYINAYTGIGSFGPYDITTIKYNPQGIQQWIRVYDSGLDDISTDMALDKQGNIYIGGLSGNKSLVIKYTPNGDTLWTRNYTETNYSFGVTSLAIDAQNNIIIGGNKEHTTNGGLSYFVIKYDPDAAFQWVSTAAINAISILYKVGFDLNGNIFATGKSGGKILTLKYDIAGLEQWRRVYDGPGSGGDAAFDMGIDNLGNAIVTGESTGLGTGVYDYITIKYSPVGDSLWVNRYNGSANDDDEAYSLALDDSNNIYITGRSINTGNSWDIVTIKYFSNGSLGWVVSYNNPIPSAEDIGYVCRVDFQRSIYITGGSRGIVNGPLDYITFKYSQLVGINPISTNLPEKITLEQNYPNF